MKSSISTLFLVATLGAALPVVASADTEANCAAEKVVLIRSAQAFELHVNWVELIAASTCFEIKKMHLRVFGQ